MNAEDTIGEGANVGSIVGVAVGMAKVGVGTGVVDGSSAVSEPGSLTVGSSTSDTVACGVTRYGSENGDVAGSIGIEEDGDASFVWVEGSVEFGVDSVPSNDPNVVFWIVSCAQTAPTGKLYGPIRERRASKILVYFDIL
jgi:hypothetical protein